MCTCKKDSDIKQQIGIEVVQKVVENAEKISKKKTEQNKKLISVENKTEKI